MSNEPLIIPGSLRQACLFARGIFLQGAGLLAAEFVQEGHVVDPLAARETSGQTGSPAHIGAYEGVAGRRSR